MTTLARITITLILAILFSSCGFDINIGNGKRGNGVVEEEHRKVTSDFTSVSASEGMGVYITQGSELEILVEADENVIDLIATDIKDGVLRIHTIESIGRANKKVYVSLPFITALETTSGAHMTTNTDIKTERLDLSATSGSKLQIKELLVNQLNIDTSSGAKIIVAGTAQNVVSSASSGSDIKAEDLSAVVCRANASSGADITINVSQSLIAEASSGGDIRYKGNAKVEQKQSSSGKVKRL